jgi:hypothetical protein
VRTANKAIQSEARTSYLVPLMASVRSEMANPALAFGLVDEYPDVEFQVSARGLSAALGAIEAEGDENHPNYWEFEGLRNPGLGELDPVSSISS